MRKWRKVKGQESAYRVSDDGEVDSLRRVILMSNGVSRTIKGKRLKKSLSSEGYLVVGVGRDRRNRTVQVHTLVLTAFVGPCPKGMECRHLNGIKTDNRITNLAWGTREENSQDKVSHGTDNRGEKHATSKFTDSQAEDIRKRFTGKRGWMSEEAKRRSVSKTTIWDIIHGRTYKK